MKLPLRNSGKYFLSLLAILAALAAAGASASAQSIYGSIRGLVTDPSGAVVASGKVMLINEGTNEQRSVVSNNLGEYVFSQVIPGTYTVEVEAPGFKKVQRKGVILETQGNLTVDLTLEVGNVSESVQVAEMT